MPQALVAILTIIVMAVAGWAMIADDRSGGEPMAIVPASPTANGAPGSPDGGAGGAGGAEARPTD